MEISSNITQSEQSVQNTCEVYNNSLFSELLPEQKRETVSISTQVEYEKEKFTLNFLELEWDLARKSRDEEIHNANGRKS